MSAHVIGEHDRVVLTGTLPGNGLVAGDVGTVVHVYPDAAAFEVEFLLLDGSTAVVATVDAAALRRPLRNEITHARDLLAARLGFLQPTWSLEALQSKELRTPFVSVRLA